MKQQLLVINRSRQRTPNLSALDRFLLGFWSLYLSPHHMLRAAVIIKPPTLLRFHEALKKRKYHLLFSTPKRASPDLRTIPGTHPGHRRDETTESTHGCPRIAGQISKVFGIDIDKDIVRRVLEKYYHPAPGTDGGPSWLTFIGHMKDSLWSVDLFRCESITLKTHWVLVIMDQFSRRTPRALPAGRIVGFGVHAGDVDGIALCCMFNKAISRMGTPKYLSCDNDPLFQYHRWKANLRILNVEEVKSVPYIPLSHPFVERLIGTIRREYLDHTLFWNASDLERKLGKFQHYYNHHRVHDSLNRNTPAETSRESTICCADLSNYGWMTLCRGLFQLPIIA